MSARIAYILLTAARTRPSKTLPMERYRITTTPPEGTEQTWVLLPDEPSATMQAEELARSRQHLRVRVYREVTGEERETVLDLPARIPSG